MTQNDLIAKQQIEIERLKLRLEWARKDKNDIVMCLTCIGGPLNDNVLRYNNKQRNYLQKILELAKNNDHQCIYEDTR